MDRKEDKKPISNIKEEYVKIPKVYLDILKEQNERLIKEFNEELKNHENEVKRFEKIITKFIIMNAFTFQIILWIDITEYDKMKRELIHITDNNKHRLMSDSGFWHGSTNENSRDKMKKILSMAVLNELTERQRICIVDYYLNGKKEKEIAKELGVNSSTVSRHIMKARDKLRHIASYYVN